MLKTALFIRNDLRLVDEIIYLAEKTSLKYIVFKDSEVCCEIEHIIKDRKIKIFNHDDFIISLKLNKINHLDYIFSYYYQRLFNEDLLSFPKMGCINFHPAPLPKYRGVGNYARAILDELDQWGASAHFMDSKIDNGDIIKKVVFSIDTLSETYLSLEQKTQLYMKNLFYTVVNDAVTNKISTQDMNVNFNEIKYTTRQMLRKLKKVEFYETKEEIGKKIRAFWSPPNSGAYIEIDGKHFTLIDDNLLIEIEKLYKKNGCKL